MRLIVERNPIFSRAKRVEVSANYIACATGGKVRIYDRGMNLIHIVDNLKYVYSCKFSPDEKRLLLVSVQNYFYVVSLSTFEVTRHMIKGEYTANLEGNGCWTLDGQGCVFCVNRRESNASALRIYPDITSGEFQEYLNDQYWLPSVSRIPEYNTYLICGNKRSNHDSCLIWYDGKTFRETIIKDAFQIGGVCAAQVDVQSGLICLRGTLGATVCDMNGETVVSLPPLQRPYVDFSFSDIFQSVPLGNKGQKTITALSNEFGLEHMRISDHVTALCYSKTMPYIYIGTLQTLYCVNMHNYTVEASLDITFGVREILEWGENSLIVASFDTVEFVRILPD